MQPIGHLAREIVARCGGDNVIPFKGAGSEHGCAAATTLMERAIRQIAESHGLIGATRVAILLLTEIAEERGGAESQSLHARILDLSEFFKPGRAA